MGELERRNHWQEVYAKRAENEVSWFQERPETSFDLIARSRVPKTAPVIDIGAGASRLIDLLLADGFTDVSVLDIAESALAKARARLGERAKAVNWIIADITAWTPPRRYRLWHDRAVLHFLMLAQDRAAYRNTLLAALEPGGSAIISTFALDGPERCSGLPVMRYSGDSLAGELGGEFRLIEAVSEDHRTPAGAIQRFQFSRLQRI
jgi:SAM-dependent methyltransferase